jgi:hypothetical protein
VELAAGAEFIANTMMVMVQVLDAAGDIDL